MGIRHIHHKARKLAPKRAWVFVVLFAAIGASLILLTRAAAPSVAFEAENTSKSGVTTISDTNASAGSALKFGAVTSGTRSCPAYPAFPNASCTGVPSGTQLTVYNGDFHTTSNGQVINGMDIRGTLFVDHNNVTIRNTYVRNTTGYTGITNEYLDTQNHTAFRPGLLIEDTTVDGSSVAENNYNGLNIGNAVARRVNAFKWSKGALLGDNTTIEDSYFHDYAAVAAESHREGLHPYYSDNVIIRHNTVMMDRADGTSGGIYGGVFGPRSVLVENNLIGWRNVGIGGGDAFTARNNHFSAAYDTTAPLSYFGGTASHCGSRWQDGPNAGQFLDSPC